MASSSSEVGPIPNRDAVRACHLAGIARAETELTTLRQLKDGLDLAIADLDKQRRSDQIANKGLLVAQFTKLTCDAFIELAAEMSKVVMPEVAAKQAEGVAKFSKLAGEVAGAASTMASGGRVDGKTTINIGKAASAYVKGDEGTKLIIKSATLKVEVVHGVMNDDSKGLLKTAFSYIYDLHVTLGELLTLKKTAVFLKIAKQTFEYNEKLQTAFDKAIDNEDESLARLHSLKTNLVIQARRVSRQIATLDAFVQSCEPAPAMILP